MNNKEREKTTYIGGVGVRLSDTERRDKMVKAAEKAGFIVECNEAIDVSFSGYSGPPYWSISASWPAKLDRAERLEAKRKLVAAWAKF